jgi:hypothetical protein
MYHHIKMLKLKYMTYQVYKIYIICYIISYNSRIIYDIIYYITTITYMISL